MRITLADLLPPTPGHLREAVYAAMAGDAAAPGGRRHGRKDVDLPDANGVSKMQSYRASLKGTDKLFEQAFWNVRAGKVAPSVQSLITKEGKKPRPVADNSEDKRAVTAHLWPVLGNAVESRLHAGQYGGREASRIQVACPRAGATCVDHVAWSLHRDIHDGYRYCVSADLVDAFGSLPRNLVLRELRRAGLDGDAADVIWRYLRRNAIDRLTWERIKFETEDGVEQGNVLSAAVLNLCLAPMLRRLGTRLDVRVYTYIDDIYIMARSLPDAEEALRRLKAMIRDAGLKPFPSLGAKQPEIIDTNVKPVLVLQVCLIDGRGIRLSYGAVLRAWAMARERSIFGHVGPRVFRKLSGCQAASRWWLRHSGVLDIPKVLPKFDEEELKNEFPGSSELGESNARTWVGAHARTGGKASDGDEGGGAVAEVGACARTEAMAMVDLKTLALVGGSRGEMRTGATVERKIPESQSTRGRRGRTRGTDASGGAASGGGLDTPPQSLNAKQPYEVATKGVVAQVEADPVQQTRRVEERERGGAERGGPDTPSYPSSLSISSDVQASRADRNYGPIEKIEDGGSRSDSAGAVRGRLRTARQGYDPQGRAPATLLLRLDELLRGVQPRKSPTAPPVLDLTGLQAAVQDAAPGELRCVVNGLLASARIRRRVTVRYRPNEAWLAIGGVLGDTRDPIYVERRRRVLWDGSLEVVLHRRGRSRRRCRMRMGTPPPTDLRVLEARVVDVARRRVKVITADRVGRRPVVVVADSPSRQVAWAVAVTMVVGHAGAAVVAVADPHGLLGLLVAATAAPVNTDLAQVRAKLIASWTWHREGSWMVGQRRR